DAWCAKRLVQQDVAALGAERHAHRVGENIYAAQHAVASVDREFDFLGSHVDVLLAVHLHPEERPSAASRSITVEAFGPLSTHVPRPHPDRLIVITEESVAGQTWAWRRLFHSPG